MELRVLCSLAESDGGCECGREGDRFSRGYGGVYGVEKEATPATVRIRTCGLFGCGHLLTACVCGGC